MGNTCIKSRGINWVSMAFIVMLCVTLNLSAQTTWVEVAAGGEFSIGLKSDGTLWSWGANLNGNLGTGDMENYNYPVQVGEDSDWKHISAGGFHVQAIKEDGSLWGWGFNDVGCTGTGSGERLDLKPTRVGGDNDWRQVNAGFAHSLALREDGSLWGWGFNLMGQIDNSGAGSIMIPRLIDSTSTWIDAKAGGLHSAAIRSDSHLFTWGFNDNGELGNGRRDNLAIPSMIDSTHTYLMVAPGTQATYAVRSDSTLWSWGFNGNKELGVDSSLNFTTLPLQIGKDKDWVHVEAGSFYGMALKENGELYAWGANVFGQLGIGQTSMQTTPAIVEGDSWNYLSLATGVITDLGIIGVHTLALREDNKMVCASGGNYAGQLGDSTELGRWYFSCDIGEITSTLVGNIEQLQMEVYPNPVSDGRLKLKNPEHIQGKYAITDIQGIVVKNGNVTGMAEQQLDVPRYPGTYILVIEGKEGVYSQKIVVGD